MMWTAAPAELGGWERAAETTLRLGGQWRVEPGLVGWRAWPWPPGQGQGAVRALRLENLSRRIRTLDPLPGCQHPASAPRAREPAAAGTCSRCGAPARQLAELLAPWWAAGATLSQVLSGLPPATRAEALALYARAFPRLLPPSAGG